MIRMIFCALAFVLGMPSPASAGEGPKPAPPVWEVLGRKSTCEVFDDCNKDASRDNRYETEVEGDTKELDNGFSDGQSGRAKLSDIIMNQMKPASGQ